MQPTLAKQSNDSSASAPFTCSTDYLVICGRAFARPIDPACATLESPLDGSKNIIAQLLRPVQRIHDGGVQLSAPFVHQSGVLSAKCVICNTEASRGTSARFPFLKSFSLLIAMLGTNYLCSGFELLRVLFSLHLMQ
jgi:hypothetical protein